MSQKSWALCDADGFDADADYLAHQENDVVGVVFTIGVGFAFDLILVDLRRNARESGRYFFMAFAKGSMRSPTALITLSVAFRSFGGSSKIRSVGEVKTRSIDSMMKAVYFATSSG